MSKTADEGEITPPTTRVPFENTQLAKLLPELCLKVCDYLDTMSWNELQYMTAAYNPLSAEAAKRLSPHPIVVCQTDPLARCYIIKPRAPDLQTRCPITELTFIWKSPVEQTSNLDLRTAAESSETRPIAIRESRQLTQFQLADHHELRLERLTVDFRAHPSRRLFWPFLHSEQFAVNQGVAQCTVLERDSTGQPLRALLCERVQDSHTQQESGSKATTRTARPAHRVSAGTITHTPEQYPRQVMWDMTAMACRLMAESVAEGTKDRFVVINVGAMGDLDRNTHTEDPAKTAEVQFRRQLANRLSVIAPWKDRSTGNGRLRDIDTSVEFVSLDDFLASPQGRSLAQYLGGDGDLSRYSCEDDLAGCNGGPSNWAEMLSHRSDDDWPCTDAIETTLVFEDLSI